MLKGDDIVVKNYSFMRNHHIFYLGHRPFVNPATSDQIQAGRSELLRRACIQPWEAAEIVVGLDTNMDDPGTVVMLTRLRAIPTFCT